MEGSAVVVTCEGSRNKQKITRKGKVNQILVAWRDIHQSQHLELSISAIFFSFHLQPSPTAAFSTQAESNFFPSHPSHIQNLTPTFLRIRSHSPNSLHSSLSYQE